MNTELAHQLALSHQENYAWALGCCGRDAREAEEVLQAVYLKVLEGRARFDGRSSLRTWVFAVIRRTAAQHRRLRMFAGLRMRALVEVPEPPDPADVEEALEHRQRRDQLWRALDRLSRRQREVVLLVFYHEHTIEEAATVMGIGVGSARTHYERGKARLRELLKETP